MANTSNRSQRSAQASVIVNPGAADIESATRNANRVINELSRRRRQLADEYTNEPTVKVTGSPMYRPYFGNNMPICINTIKIYVPLDGTPYEIPETFAAEFYRRIHRVDEQIAQRNRMADVRSNLESYAGELNLITKA